MNIDIQIIGIAVLMFLVFLVLQAVVFRYIATHRGLVWILRIASVVGLLGSCTALYVSREIEFFFFPFLVYGTLIVLYVFGVFVIIESSITFRILYEFARLGTKGGRQQDFVERYNKNIIVSRRLDRLVVIGQILEQHEMYWLRQKKSVFTFRNILVKFNNFVFPFKS